MTDAITIAELHDPDGEVIENLRSAINGLASMCHAQSFRSGFWHEDRNKAEMIALMHSELSEALEVLRVDTNAEGFDLFQNKQDLAEEMADTIIRVLDFCHGFKLNIGDVLLTKMAKNASRPYKHGKAF